MKKLLFLLWFTVFFYSCIPMENVTSDEYLNIRVHNKSSKSICIHIRFDVDEKKGWTNKRDSIAPDSIAQMYGVGFDEDIRNSAFSVLNNRIVNKNLIVFNMNGDTIASWTDTSIIFCNHQFWRIDTNTGNNFVYCTLQLTDEVLELK